MLPRHFLTPQDPFISAALGPNAKLERMRAASLRLGGQGLTTSYDDHLLIIGDAAGHIDPLTGALLVGAGAKNRNEEKWHHFCVPGFSWWCTLESVPGALKSIRSPLYHVLHLTF